MQHRSGRAVVLLCAALLTVVATKAGAGEGKKTELPLQSWSTVEPKGTKRFILLEDFADEAVLDTETQLVWQRSPGPELRQWFWARVHCFRDTVVGGKRGWRLPTIEELTTLLAPIQENPSLPPGHPFLTIDLRGFYWTATRRDDGVAEVWGVTFNPRTIIGYQVHFADMVAAGLTWCVRGGQGPDGQ